MNTSLYILPLLVGCGILDATKDSGDSGMTACLGMECRDAMTLTVLGVNGEPEQSFSGTATPAQGEAVSFVCEGGTGSGLGYSCQADGVVQLYVYADVVTVYVSQGPDGASWSGDLRPEWDAPYDSEQCGHYCYLTDASVTLEPCGDCG